MDKRSAQIQALLFAEGGALTYKSLAKSLQCDEGELAPVLDALAASLMGSGLSLIRTDSEASLVVSPEARDVVMEKVAAEYERNIGDAGLEILAILLYEGPSTRATIDYIRGVNSSSTIRNLLARGLVERTGNPVDGREFIYRATTELYAHLGIRDKTELPEHGTISRELADFKQGAENHGSGPESGE